MAVPDKEAGSTPAAPYLVSYNGFQACGWLLVLVLVLQGLALGDPPEAIVAASSSIVGMMALVKHAW